MFLLRRCFTMFGCGSLPGNLYGLMYLEEMYSNTDLETGVSTYG
jgi:DNA-binding transcriptional regulator GbsR (MarR family)